MPYVFTHVVNFSRTNKSLREIKIRFNMIITKQIGLVFHQLKYNNFCFPQLEN